MISTRFTLCSRTGLVTLVAASGAESATVTGRRDLFVALLKFLDSYEERFESEPAPVPQPSEADWRLLESEKNHVFITRSETVFTDGFRQLDFILETDIEQTTSRITFHGYEELDSFHESVRSFVSRTDSRTPVSSSSFRTGGAL